MYTDGAPPGSSTLDLRDDMDMTGFHSSASLHEHEVIVIHSSLYKRHEISAHTNGTV